ncbi:MAG: hypothetical protein HUJ63_13085 [Enterococcus sp.]|nr:hypothetical protein [Enterococcus sp.]
MNRYGAPQAPQPLDGASPIPDLAPEQRVDPPQNLNEQQNHAWAALRAQSSANRRLAEEYRAKYNAVVGDAAKMGTERKEYADQLAQRDARIKELENEIGRTDLSRAPEFRERYDAPIAALRDKVDGILAANGYSAEQASELADRILTTAPGEVPKMIENLPTHVQGMIMIHAQDADRLWAERDGALENWKSSADGLAAVATRNSAVIDAQRAARLADEAILRVRSMSPAAGQVPAFQVVDPAFVAEREAKENQFRAWFAQAPEDQKCAAMFEGFIAPMTYKMLEHTWRENQQLKRLLYARGRVASPPIAPSPAYVPATPPAPPPATPTVATAGYSDATPQADAASFAQTLISGMLSGGAPSVAMM